MNVRAFQDIFCIDSVQSFWTTNSERSIRKAEKGYANHTKQRFLIRYQPETPLHGSAAYANKRIILGQDTIKL